MTQSGDPLDNAVAERANGILKTEWLYRMTIPTHKACKRELKRIISFESSYDCAQKVRMVALENQFCA